MPQHAEAESVHERIALVALVKINLARNGGDAKAIPVMRDAGHNAGEQPLVICDLRFAVLNFGVSAFGERWLALTPPLSPGEREIASGSRCEIRRGFSLVADCFPLYARRGERAVRWAIFRNRSEAQGVDRANRPGAHREDVAHDAAHAGGRALKRLDCARMVVRLYLERDGQAVADVNDAGVFLARADEDFF